MYRCGDDVNAQNNNGDTPLHRACHCGYDNVVAMLMAAGADKSMVNMYGQTPVQCIADYIIDDQQKKNALLQLMGLLKNRIT